jgi:hypothetical protein
MEISTVAASQQPAAVKLATEEDPNNSTQRQALEVVQDNEPSQPKQKKSLAFKLSFIGLAAILFVFQIDATALGIALPVSNSPRNQSNHH